MIGGGHGVSDPVSMAETPEALHLRLEPLAIAAPVALGKRHLPARPGLDVVKPEAATKPGEIPFLPTDDMHGPDVQTMPAELSQSRLPIFVGNQEIGYQNASPRSRWRVR